MEKKEETIGFFQHVSAPLKMGRRRLDREEEGSGGVARKERKRGVNGVKPRSDATLGG